MLSEREIMAAERLAEKRLYSARLLRDRGHHRADLIRLGGEGPEAIEVELTLKAPARLDFLIRSWRLAIAERKVRGVLYCCSPETLAGVKRSIARVRAVGQVRVEPLSEYYPPRPSPAE